MTGPRDPAAAGDGLRAGHADRERVIEALKDAFVQGRLTMDELDARAGLALAARTLADLAALTADIPPAPAPVPAAPAPVPPAQAPAPAPVPAAAAGTPRRPTRAHRRPLAKAAAGASACLAFAFAAVLFAANVLDPHGLGNPYHPWSSLCVVVALAAVVAAFGIMANGVATSAEQRRSRRQLPHRPGPDGRALDGGQHGGAGPAPDSV